MKIPCRMAPARVPPSSAASHLVMTAGWQLLKPLGNPGRPARHRCRFLATYVGADWSAGHTGAGADYHLAVIRNRRRLSPSSISIAIFPEPASRQGTTCVVIACTIDCGSTGRYRH
jgi:hypothetical protein